MTTLQVRKLLIDLDTPLPRHWCGGDAFRTAFFNALSMSFPAGEQFFIDAVRAGVDRLPPEVSGRFRAEVQGFIGQEATHRRIHALFNGHLERQGLVNAWEGRIKHNGELMKQFDLRHSVAVTAATEHFTAIFADWLLGQPAALEGCEPRLRTLWQWHASEEEEHKCTAFDLYLAMDGSTEWRIRWFRRVTMIFLGNLTRQTLSNLRRDGTLWRLGTWTSAWRTLFGDKGLIRNVFPAWRQYFRPDFHPAQLDSGLARRWLDANTASYQPVGEAGAVRGA